MEKYAEAWRQYVDRVNCDRFCGGGFPARFTEKDKQEFIRTLALIDTGEKVSVSNPASS